MTGDTPSLQDVLRQRQPHDFVGRDARLAEFGANLALPLADPDRRFIVNLHGVAGVGKTFLAQQYRRLAESKGAVCAYVDEDCFDVVETMAAVAADFDLQQVRMPGFETQLATYRQRRHELESDPKAPIGDLVTSTTVRMSMSMMKTVPVAGMAAEVMDPDAVANQLNRLRHYLGQRFSKRADVDLLLKPVEVLSKAFVAGLNDLAEDRPVVLFFDTFERTAPFLETWLLDLFGGKFGNLTANLVTTIGGQHPLSSSGWMPLRSLIATHPLEPFTEEEALDFLARRGVSEADVVKVILGLSGRIPMWMATLAEKNPQDPGSVIDPSEGAVQRFLKWEPDLERQHIAKAGALPRRFNRDILAAAVGDAAEVETLFGWLCRLPFVSRSSEHWRYHDAVRDPMVRLARTTSPQQWRESNQRLATHFSGERAALGLSDDDGWSDPAWQNLLIEEHYHRLCATPTTMLVPSLEHAANATWEGVSLARRWSAMLTAAGEATDFERLRIWGRRLTELLQGEEADDIAYLTELIERAELGSRSMAEAIASRGESHRLRQHFDLALADQNRALEAAPDEPRFLRLRSQALSDLQRFEETLADLGRAIELDPGNSRSWGYRAESFRLLGRHGEALRDIDRAIALDPGYEWALAERGANYRALERHEEALADFDRAISLDPDYEWAIARRGLTYLDLERHEEALADFDRAIELNPGKDWYFGQRGYVYQTLERYEEALADFGRALEMDPADDWYMALQGYILRSMERHEESLAEITRAIELDPNHTWYRFQRALTYRALQRYEEALPDINRAIEISPDYKFAFAERAYLRRFLTGDEEALADFNRAIQLDPEYQWAIAQRGSTYRYLNRYEEALADLDRAIELGPDADWVFAERGYTYQALNRYEEALADLDRAIELDPEYEWATAIRGFAYLRIGRYAEALADLDHAIELDPSSSWNRFLKACVLCLGGENQRHRPEILAAVELVLAEAEAEPDDAVHGFNLLVYRISLGQTAASRELLDNLMSGVPADSAIIDFLEDLDFVRSLPGIDLELVTELEERAKAGLRQPR